MSKYKHGKQTDALSPEAFAEIMQKGPFVKPVHKAFLAVLYYTGARVSEILRLEKKDFHVIKDVIFIQVKASKHGVKRGDFQIKFTWPFAPFILAAYKHTRARKRVFPFSRQTGWNIVKRVLPEKYPHFFRLNRCVHFLNNPDMTLNKIRQWFAWKNLNTVSNYLGEMPETVGEMSETVE